MRKHRGLPLFHWTRFGALRGIRSYRRVQASTLDSLLAIQIDRPELIAVALTLGILCFAVVTSIMLVRTSRRLAETEASARDGIMAARAETDRVNALLRSDPQVLVAWAAAVDKPEVIGDTALVTGDSASHRLLAFSAWLAPEEARTMERLVAQLRARGEGFTTTLTTRNGRPIEAEGHVIGGRAILRLKDVSGIKRELAELSARFQKQMEETEALRTLVEALPFPIWARDEAGKLIAVNQAYARAVDARDIVEAVGRGTELFDRSAREEIFRAHEAAKAYTGRLPAIVAGARRIFDVLTFPTRRGSSGIGIEFDRSRIAARRDQAHDRGASAHARPAPDRGRDLRLQPEARLLQHGLPVAMGHRRRLS